MAEAVPSAAAVPAANRPIRVMIVDDAVVVRGLLSRWLTDAGGIEVASTHRTGAEAVAAIDRVKPDVILLDIEMPDMDGITALPLLLDKQPTTTVIVASTLTTRNAEISLRCLDLGAMDYIAKPSTNRDVTFSTDFRREIIAKVMTLGQRTVRGYLPRAQGHAGPSLIEKRHLAGAAAPPSATEQSYTLRPFAKVTSRVLSIGASTGGPNAITELLRLCQPAIQRMPVIIAQHMPIMFTGMFADHLKRLLSMDASEARHGEAIEKGRIYIAPGGKHLRVEKGAAGIRAVIDDAPPINFCKPSVDLTMSSISKIYGPGTLGVMLTGMGSDGLRGAADVVEAGGNVIAQDEASSVVWGMPGVVARRGLCAAVEPIDRLARIINMTAGCAS
jgi:two-component system, chemotaxis family, protein-glutamate methylesterase/glutaminase